MKSDLFVVSFFFAAVLNTSVLYAQRFTSKSQTMPAPAKFDTVFVNAEKSYLALKAGDLDNARKFLSLADASNPFAMYVRATLTPEAAQAVGMYKLIVNQFPDKPIAREALIQLYKYHYAAGDYRLARTDYLQLQKYPGMTQLIDPAGLSDKFPVVNDSVQSPAETSEQTIETGSTVPNQEAPSVASQESYAVQLGVFSTRANADKFVAQLKTNDVNALVSTKQAEGRMLFAVTTGDFKTREAAEAFAEDLKRRSINCIVVRTGESEE